MYPVFIPYHAERWEHSCNRSWAAGNTVKLLKEFAKKWRQLFQLWCLCFYQLPTFRWFKRNEKRAFKKRFLRRILRLWFSEGAVLEEIWTILLNRCFGVIFLLGVHSLIKVSEISFQDNAHPSQLVWSVFQTPFYTIQVYFCGLGPSKFQMRPRGCCLSEAYPTRF